MQLVLSKDYSGFDLSPVEILLFIQMCFRSDDQGYCNLKTDELALYCSCSRPLISRSLKRLNECGLIEVLESARVGESNSYLTKRSVEPQKASKPSVEPQKASKPSVEPQKASKPSVEPQKASKPQRIFSLFELANMPDPIIPFLDETPEETERLNKLACEASMSRLRAGNMKISSKKKKKKKRK